MAEHWDGMTLSLRALPTPGYWELFTGPEFTGVSCASGRDCIAVGTEAITSAGIDSMLERWNGTRWSLEHTDLALGDVLHNVSCSSSSNCMAVGYSDHSRRPLTERWNGARWSLHWAAKPTGVSSSSLDAVACPSNRWCYAIGSYTSYSTESLEDLRLAESWDGVKWSIESISQPPGAKSMMLESVSCPTPNFCIAVGWFTDQSDHDHAIAATRTTINPAVSG
jgi:hypothetical protein